jgi:hypothetical protein
MGMPQKDIGDLSDSGSRRFVASLCMMLGG